jgi:tetratricopeptide (TPR) repeat protein
MAATNQKSLASRLFFVYSFLCLSVVVYAGELSDLVVPLREAVYEQTLDADGIIPLYEDAKGKLPDALSGPALSVALSRCEYLMGLAYQNDERKRDAARHYEAGMELAQRSLDEGVSAEGWRMLAANLAQACAVKSAAYVIANGLKVEKYSKNALALDPDNAAAKYLIASRWMFAPAPLHNHKRGIQMMEDIIREGENIITKDERFSACSAIGYGYIQQKDYEAARLWLKKSLALYPTNKFAGDMLQTAMLESGGAAYWRTKLSP